MPNTLAKILLLVLAGFFLFWEWFTLRHRLGNNTKEHPLLKPIYLPAVIMTLAIAANAMVIMDITYLNFIEEFNRAVYNIDGSISQHETSQWDLLAKQLSILLGTGSLMLVIRQAINDEYPNSQENQKTFGLELQANMYKRLMVRYWWVVIGAGAAFGITAGPGIPLLLAAELTIMWLGCRLAIWIMKHSKSLE